MPLWRIYHPADVFTDAVEKQALSEAITAIYRRGPLPDFYVVVTFIPLPADSIFVGAKAQPSSTSPTFVRFVLSHLARTMPEGNHQRKINFLNLADAALKPFVADKGWEWELHVEETDRHFWRIQGKNPPLPETEAEKLWIRENKPVDYEGAYAPSVAL